MAVDRFSFAPAEVPQAARGRRTSKYATTLDDVDQYLREHEEATSVKIDLGGVDIKTAAASFRKAVAKKYPQSMHLVQRGGALYIERK